MGEDLGTRLLSKHKRAVDREFAGYPGPDVLFEYAPQGPCSRLRFCGSALDGLVARSKVYVSAGFNQRFLKDTDYPGAESAKIRKIAAPAQEDAPCPDHMPCHARPGALPCNRSTMSPARSIVSSPKCGPSICTPTGRWGASGCKPRGTTRPGIPARFAVTV